MKRIVYKMGKLICVFFDTFTKVRMYGLHLIFMSLLFYMFQSILKKTVFLHFLMGKINYFHGWGVHPRPIRKKFCKDT